MERVTDQDFALTAALLAGHVLPAEVDDWAGVVETALAEGVGPSLHHLLRARGLSPPGFSRLEQATHRAARHFMLLDIGREGIETALQSRGIPIVWLKGIALAHRVYPSPGLRTMGDLDGLIPVALLERAVAALQELGYDIVHTSITDVFNGRTGITADSQPLMHHVGLLGGPAGGVHFELHHRLCRDQDLLSLDQHDWFWEQVDDSRPLPTLTAEANLLHLCIHAELHHGRADTFLRTYYDLHLLTDRCSIEWDTVVSRAAELGWSQAVERALEHCRVLFRSPVPRPVLQALSRYQEPGAQWHMTHLSGRGRTWYGVLQRLQGLPLSLKLRFLRQIIAPDRQYMRKRYKVKPGVPVWPYYLVRWGGQLAGLVPYLLLEVRRRLSSR